MLSKIRKSWVMIALTLAVSVNIFTVTPVLADDGIPPVEVIPADGIDVTLQAESEAPLVTEASVPILEQNPNEEIAVLNENGEVISIASHQAETVVQSGDPMWCPAGVTPVAGVGGCSPSFNLFGTTVGDSNSELLAWLALPANQPKKAGVVWIEGTYHSNTLANNETTTSDIIFNGGSLTSMKDFALTLKGGWTGTGTNISPYSYSTFDTDSLRIINWVGNLTLSDIRVTNATTGINNSAFDVETQGNIILTRVKVDGNDATLNGATISNAFLGKNGTITITDSYFDGNYGYGLRVWSNNAVSITGTQAFLNAHGAGLIVENNLDTTPSPVTLKNIYAAGSGISSSGVGISIFSNGVVTLDGIDANTNNNYGVLIDTTSNTAGTASIVLNNLNVFRNNSSDGLHVVTYSPITIKHIVATGNGGDGVNLTNTSLNLVKPITVSGSGQFDTNSGEGLQITSSGLVTLNNINSANNGGSGVIVDADNSNVLSSGVVIKGVNNFNNNTGSGLIVYADGVITIENVTANDNAVRGIYLDNDAPPSGTPAVTINGFLTTLNNGLQGAYILSDGVITAINLTANNNGNDGVYIDNDASPSPMAVILNGFNTFTGNQNDGLEITSRGAVTINAVNANGNGLGADSYGVIINNAFDVANQQAVTIKTPGAFIGNSFGGLKITSYGVVSLTGVTANNNGEGLSNSTGDGVSITNSGGVLAKAVTISGSNVFNDNDGYGLYVNSRGAITISNITASGNDFFGASLSNSLPSSQSPVTINGYGIFENNLLIGLSVNSHGSFTSNNLGANYNGSNGLDIDVQGLTSPAAVTLKGINSFNYNTLAGLVVDADGSINLSNLSANYNGGSGAILNNLNNWNGGPFTARGSVTITGFGNFFGNITGDGLSIVSPGTVTLSRISAFYNGDTATDDGISINATGNVTLTCVNSIKNFDRGLFISTSGNLILKGYYAFGNASSEALSVSGTTTRLPCP
ncbi:MAG: right-handed parallel beta-helix repeat-containing protein [Anaerolineales bacterium]